MRVGYCYEEHFKFAYQAEWQELACRWINCWKDTHWCVAEFPLIEDRITHYKIKQYWEGEGIDFPKESNCLKTVFGSLCPASEKF